jgi:hypothetical protein
MEMAGKFSLGWRQNNLSRDGSVIYIIWVSKWDKVLGSTWYGFLAAVLSCRWYSWFDIIKSGSELSVKRLGGLVMLSVDSGRLLGYMSGLI